MTTPKTFEEWAIDFFGTVEPYYGAAEAAEEAFEAGRRAGIEEAAQHCNTRSTTNLTSYSDYLIGIDRGFELAFAELRALTNKEGAQDDHGKDV